MMDKANWLWMPHAGHFIGSTSCRFKLNTYVGKYIVSTVGELHWENREVQNIHAKIRDPKWFMENNHLQGDYFDNAYMIKFGFEDLGFNRKYETMVFEARKSKLKCCPWEINVKKEADMQGYKAVADATAGHLELCNKWTR